VSGIPAADFLFLGFLPHKKGREKLFKEIAGEKRAVVFYESPHRIEKALASLAEHLGSRKVVLARELTKIHEEVIEGTATLLLAHLAQNKEKIRGEFVVLVFPQ
jgi:16S rRNA (cytidine1402-2'-O)-methyltransferase